MHEQRRIQYKQSEMNHAKDEQHAIKKLPNGRKRKTNKMPSKKSEERTSSTLNQQNQIEMMDINYVKLPNKAKNEMRKSVLAH